MTWQADHAFLRERGWRRGEDGLWRTDARGGSFKTRNALAYERGEPTPAQAELLTWLVAQSSSPDDTWRGGDLIEYYRQRQIRKDRRRGLPEMLQGGGGGYANHGWRRAGGTALKNLAARGFMRQVGLSYGTALFRLTDLGRAAEEAGRAAD